MTRTRTGLLGVVALAVLSVVGLILGAPSGFGLLWFVPFAGVGTILAVRRPGTSIGWLLILLGWAFVLVTMSIDATPTGFVNHTVGLVTSARAIANAVASPFIFFLFAVIALVFPTGHLPPGRARRPAAIALAISLVTVLVGLVQPVISVALLSDTAQNTNVQNPLAVLPDLPLWQVVTPTNITLVQAALMVAASLSLAARYRSSSGVERQQLRWLAAAIAAVVISVLVGFVADTLVPDVGATGVVWLGAIVAFPCVPLAIGIAVLRYRLYDIDRLISRTLGWAVVSGVIGAVFVLGVVGLQTLLAGYTQGGTLAIAASTLIAFGLFQPVRSRIQAAIDRRFDRARYDADRTAVAFAERLRNETDMATVTGELGRTARSALAPAGLGVWIRGGGR